MIKKTLLAATFAALPFLANAQGYWVYLQSARHTGMGHVGVGLRPDASSIFMNPGSTSLMEKNSISAGVSFISAKTAFQQSGTTANGTAHPVETNNNPISTPFYLYGVWGPKGEGLASKFKFGLGVYTPFGSSVDWGTSWSGRAALSSISLRSICIQPTVSFKITDNFGIGAGFVYSVGGVNLQRVARTGFSPNPATEGLAELDGAANGMGFNVGIFYQPIKQVSFGISYRSQIDMTVDNGTATMNNIGSVSPLFPTTSFKATLPLPAIASFGVGVYVNEKLTLSGELNYGAWSAYDALKINYGVQGTGWVNINSPRNYSDNFVFRVGGEYKLMENLDVRLGYAYAITPVPNGSMTPETPDANRNNFFAGASYRIGESLRIDAALQLVNVDARTDTNTETNIRGTYKTNATVGALGVAYSF